jgi:hypothetical protein
MSHKKKNPGGLHSTKKHGGLGDKFEKSDQRLPWDEIKMKEEVVSGEKGKQSITEKERSN